MDWFNYIKAMDRESLAGFLNDVENGLVDEEMCRKCVYREECQKFNDCIIESKHENAYLYFLKMEVGENGNATEGSH